MIDPSRPPSPEERPASADRAPPSADDSAAPAGEEMGDAKRDPMAPPKEPCECWCMHCKRTFMSDGMWFQRVIGDKHGFDGFWMCPTPNCGGAGFGFDIHPTDPNHPENAHWVYDDDEDVEEGEWEDGEFIDGDDEDGADAEWDPDESHYKELDELTAGEEGDDIEGEEWKYGLQPGEPPPETPAQAESRRRWEEEQRKYDLPDERPRVVDWTNRPDPPGRPTRAPGEEFSDDDIPF